MPTNKLWLEHTEKAAWESVQALRDKIADAERRIERLGPPIAAWQPLLDELDRARSELGLSGEHYVDVLRTLLERAAADRQRVKELERERERERERARLAEQSEREKLLRQSEQPVDVTALLRQPDPGYFDDDIAEDDDQPQPHRVSQITRDAERRRRELLADRALPSDLDALLRSIDAKVADLSDVEGLALSDAALDLGVLALTLAALHDDD
jgi:hypothetical protein